MAIAIIPSSAYASFPFPAIGAGGAFLPVGDPDLGVCMQVSGDGKYADLDPTVIVDSLDVVFTDDGITLPLGATINSVTFNIMAKGTQFTLGGAMDGLGPYYTDQDLGQPLIPWVPDPTPSDTKLVYTLYSTGAHTVNPATSLPWVRDEVFSRTVIAATDHDRWFIAFIDTPLDSFRVDYAYLSIDYSGGSTWYYNPATNHFQYTASDPGHPWVPAAPTLSNLAIQPTSGSTAGGD